MSANEEPRGDVSNSVAAETPVVSGTPSRIIEYFPPTLAARDCQYSGFSYSKGSVVKQADGLYRCTGDEDGSWEKVKK
jgi:hypothetical protein